MIRPVLVAIGEICDRPDDIANSLDPLGLMAEAARRAEADLGTAILGAVDSVDVVHQISWRYEDTARRLCERLAINPPHAVYHPGGGESPLRILHDAALRIARGETSIALICGGEARNTAKKARAAGIEMPWPKRASVMEHPWDTEKLLSPKALAHGTAQPTFVYPLYENATLHAWGQSPAKAHAESAALWARFAQIAADNPYAWQRRAPEAVQIASLAPENPIIAYPYTRLMVANPTVNLGAAVIVMAEEIADAYSVPADRRVYFSGGAAAKEPDDYLQRDSYASSPAQQVVLDCARTLVSEAGFDALELYSCFPCVPKMARRVLGIEGDFDHTVTGGLTFFGGPFNNYMLHATCAMVRRLRGGRQAGLLYGQGDFVTKHHAVVLSGLRSNQELNHDYRLDTQADELRGPVPRVVDQAQGEAQLETFTILPDRSGAFDRGIVVLRLSDGARTMARVPATDKTTLDQLASQQLSPIGRLGRISTGTDNLLEWTML